MLKKLIIKCNFLRLIQFLIRKRAIKVTLSLDYNGRNYRRGNSDINSNITYKKNQLVMPDL